MGPAVPGPSHQDRAITANPPLLLNYTRYGREGRWGEAFAWGRGTARMSATRKKVEGGKENMVKCKRNIRLRDSAGKQFVVESSVWSDQRDS